MNNREQGFTLMETLVALMVVMTLLFFVVPLYLTGKEFFQQRMLENRARLLAQSELEKRLSALHPEKKEWFSIPYHIVTEVTRQQPLWKVQVTVQWKDIAQQK